MLAQQQLVEDFVYISEQAAMHLAETGVRAVGIDYLSVGGYRADGAKIHQILLQAGIWIIEGLDLSPVIGGRYEMICLPVKLHGNDGGTSPGRSQTHRQAQPRPGRFRRDVAMRLLLVGGGPAGNRAVMQARELGADVTLLEAQQVGGTSLNSGPAPLRTCPGPPGWPGTAPRGSALAWTAAPSWSKRPGTRVTSASWNDRPDADHLANEG